MVKKRRIAGAAAGCAVAVATLLGAPSAMADGHESCVKECIQPPPGLFIKFGATETAFNKIQLHGEAFNKIGEEFPFSKWTPQ